MRQHDVPGDLTNDALDRFVNHLKCLHSFHLPAMITAVSASIIGVYANISMGQITGPDSRFPATEANINADINLATPQMSRDRLFVIIGNDQSVSRHCNTAKPNG